MKSIVISLFIVLSMFVSVADAQKRFFKSIDRLPENSTPESIERFMFFTNCAPVWVHLFTKSNKQVQINKKSVMDVIESRLRSARIFFDKNNYKKAPVPLYVSLRSVRNDTFEMSGISIQLSKAVQEIHDNMTGWATVWEDDKMIPYTNQHDILSNLSQMMDKFIAKYLRVNQKACA